MMPDGHWRLSEPMRSALNALDWNGMVRAGSGYNLRTLRALEARGYCYLSWNDGACWKAGSSRSS